MAVNPVSRRRRLGRVGVGVGCVRACADRRRGGESEREVRGRSRRRREGFEATAGWGRSLARVLLREPGGGVAEGSLVILQAGLAGRRFRP